MSDSHNIIIHHIVNHDTFDPICENIHDADTAYVSSSVSEGAVQTFVLLTTRTRPFLSWTNQQLVSFSYEIFSSRCLSSGYIAVQGCSIEPFLFFHSDNVTSVPLFPLFSLSPRPSCTNKLPPHFLLQGMASQIYVWCVCLDISSEGSLL